MAVLMVGVEGPPGRHVVNGWNDCHLSGRQQAEACVGFTCGQESVCVVGTDFPLATCRVVCV